MVFIGLLYTGWRFAHGNSTVVDVDYVVGRSRDVAVWKALVVSAGVGMAITFVLMIFSLIGARLEARRFRKAAVGLESELNELRQLHPSSEIVAQTVDSEDASIVRTGRGVVQKA